MSRKRKILSIAVLQGVIAALAIVLRSVAGLSTITTLVGALLVGFLVTLCALVGDRLGASVCAFRAREQLAEQLDDDFEQLRGLDDGIRINIMVLSRRWWGRRFFRFLERRGFVNEHPDLHLQLDYGQGACSVAFMNRRWAVYNPTTDVLYQGTTGTKEVTHNNPARHCRLRSWQQDRTRHLQIVYSYPVGRSFVSPEHTSVDMDPNKVLGIINIDSTSTNAWDLHTDSGIRDLILTRILPNCAVICSDALSEE